MAVRIDKAELAPEKALWPDVRPWDWLMRIKGQMPGPMYGAQYLNDPSQLKGVRYNLDWLQFYLPAELPPLGQLIGGQTGDPATSERESSNYFGHCTGGRDPLTGIIYVLGFAFGNIASPGHLGFMREQYQYWEHRGLQVDSIHLEEVGPQQGTTQNLIAQTRVDPSGAMPIEIYKPKGSKEQRFDTLGPWMKNGTVLFPGVQKGEFIEMIDNPGFQEFQSEFVNFPRGGRDDLLDAFHMLVDIHTTGGVAVSVRESDMEQSEERLESQADNEPDLIAQKKERIRKALEELEQQESSPRDRVLAGSRSGSRTGLFH